VLGFYSFLAQISQIVVSGLDTVKALEVLAKVQISGLILDIRFSPVGPELAFLF
jgi:hypothetical protein